LDVLKLFFFRHDGKDSLKFYTEPGYFFELWCQAMQKDTKCQMKRHKRVRRPVSESLLLLLKTKCIS